MLSKFSDIILSVPVRIKIFGHHCAAGHHPGFFAKLLGAIRALSGLLRANARLGKYRLASMYGEQAIRIAGQIGDRESELILLYLLSETLFNQDQPEKAFQTLEQATAIARELENWGWQIQLLSTGRLYCIYIHRGGYSEPPGRTQAHCLAASFVLISQMKHSCVS